MGKYVIVCKLSAKAIIAQLFHLEIPNAIDQLQSDNCSIADATEIWIKLGEKSRTSKF